MKKKKTSRHFFRILTLLFIMFCALYIILESGYYQSKLSKQSALTEEQIKKFEKDVKKGKIVDLNKYTIEENVDYSNNVTKVGTTISENLNEFMTEGIGTFVEALKKMFS